MLKSRTGSSPSDAYLGVRALVTGGAGFIGRWVARLLDDAGSDLWILDRDGDRLKRVADSWSIRGRQIVKDLSCEGAFADVYDNVRPDIIFNLAGYGITRTEVDEDLSWKINAGLVGEIVSAVAEDEGPPIGWKGLRLVHVGSGFEYGSVFGEVTENSPPNPGTLYGRSKLEGTQIVQNWCSDGKARAVAARLFTVYGPGEAPQRLLPSLLRAARSKEPLKLTAGEQLRDFTYVRDVADGLLRLGQVANVPGGIVNLATGSLKSVREFVECAVGLLGLEPERLHFGAIPYRLDELLQGSVNTSFLEGLTGWIPAYSIREGLQETIELENLGCFRTDERSGDGKR